MSKTNISTTILKKSISSPHSSSDRTIPPTQWQMQKIIIIITSRDAEIRRENSTTHTKKDESRLTSTIQPSKNSHSKGTREEITNLSVQSL